MDARLLLEVIVLLLISASLALAVVQCVRANTKAATESHDSVTKAVRYAVTLINNEGAFVALCTQKMADTWVFEDVTLTPTNPGAPVVKAADGKLFIPTAHILYYQEIVEIANVAQ